MTPRITHWTTCSCGRPFRTRTHEKCEDCRKGWRPGILRHRMMLQSWNGRRSMRRLWKGIER